MKNKVNIKAGNNCKRIRTIAIQQTTSHTRYRVWLLSIIALILMTAVQLVHAEDNPKVLLEGVSKDMITALNEHRDRIKQDPA